jgi:predicted HD phosphohydrolase
MTAAEAERFENDPLFEASIRMRHWDELAKETEVPILDLSVLKEKAKRIHLKKQRELN